MRFGRAGLGWAIAAAVLGAALAGTLITSTTRSHAAAKSGAAAAPSSLGEIVVYKSPTCGCCDGWITHLRASGFAVTARDTSDVGAVKRRLGVLPTLESCHTAFVAGYVVEGHVPADAIARLLEERPPIVGIAVPGMPAGSPGMENAQPYVSYEVIAFDAQGRTSVFARY